MPNTFLKSSSVRYVLCGGKCFVTRHETVIHYTVSVIYLLDGRVHPLGALPLELFIGEPASLIVLLEFFLHRSDSLGHLLPIRLV